MQVTANVVAGSIKVLGVVEEYKFTSMADFINAIPHIFAVEIPSEELTNVTVGNTQPRADQTRNLWVRTNNAGDFAGLFVFSGGNWNQIAPLPGQLVRMYGNSTKLPAGTKLADSTNPNLTATQSAAIMSFWVSSDDGTYFTVFDVTLD